MRTHDLLTIGELAARAGVSVRAVRFYSDQGLLPEADRSSGGHRRYAPQALERLRLIRSLRGLGVPLPEVAAALEEEQRLGQVVERQLDAVAGELRALRWREAALQLLHTGPPGERAELLRLVGALGSPPSTDSLARYWRRVLPTRLPARLAAAVVDAAVPPVPEAPAPGQVLAFARLHQLTGSASDACLAEHRPVVPRPELLYEGLREAYELAAPALTAGRAPEAGEALDCFVAAHARAQDRRDTPAFRRELRHTLAGGEHPVMRRYWSLAGELSPVPTLGAANGWLSSALNA
ncbi:MerR family transcriptional regulator [Kitasatospora sp. NPDC002227]|uniref:helix-turn-helix domain-containing protein n=1 Tax=Kitasatospora sp. NPDC002227 TaxID=3154773 RepID=UPI003324CF6D